MGRPLGPECQEATPRNLPPVAGALGPLIDALMSLSTALGQGERYFIAHSILHVNQLCLFLVTFVLQCVKPLVAGTLDGLSLTPYIRQHDINQPTAGLKSWQPTDY